MTTGHGVTIRQATDMVLSPQDVVDNATTQAKLLMSIVEQTRCFQQIAGKKYLQVEAWETIGAFNRTHAETEWVHPIKGDTGLMGYEAKVNLLKDGQVIGSGIMPAYFSEACCRGKEGDAKHKAAMSAAQTFATSKAYRMNFSYVAILAGYQPSPAEELNTDDVAVENTPEHWCTLHKTAFFKRGKMKGYAHPVEGSDGEWCNEPEAADSPTSTPAVAKSEGVKAPASTEHQGAPPKAALPANIFALPAFKGVNPTAYSEAVTHLQKLPNKPTILTVAADMHVPLKGWKVADFAELSEAQVGSLVNRLQELTGKTIWKPEEPTIEE